MLLPRAAAEPPRLPVGHGRLPATQPDQNCSPTVGASLITHPIQPCRRVCAQGVGLPLLDQEGRRVRARGWVVLVLDGRVGGAFDQRALAGRRPLDSRLLLPSPCPAAGRYHLFVSLACPWACRCVAALHMKVRQRQGGGTRRGGLAPRRSRTSSPAGLPFSQGLQDVIGLSVTHPTWQLTRPGQDEHAGWAFAAPSDPPLSSATGHGSFPCDGCIPDTGASRGAGQGAAACPCHHHQAPSSPTQHPIHLHHPLQSLAPSLCGTCTRVWATPTVRGGLTGLPAGPLAGGSRVPVRERVSGSPPSPPALTRRPWLRPAPAPAPRQVHGAGPVGQENGQHREQRELRNPAREPGPPRGRGQGKGPWAGGRPGLLSPPPHQGLAPSQLLLALATRPRTCPHHPLSRPPAHPHHTVPCIHPPAHPPPRCSTRR